MPSGVPKMTRGTRGFSGCHLLLTLKAPRNRCSATGSRIKLRNSPQTMIATVKSAIATFGAKAKEKLSNPAATGQPEDQLRAPFEHLLADLAELSNLPKSAVAAVGESSLSDLKTR